MPEFTDKVALITGAGTGLGREVALAFGSLGCSVAANDINPLGVDDTVESIGRNGGNARAYVFDIAKRMPVEGLVAQVLDHFGRIDYLINHAAVIPDAALLEMDEWEFHRTLDVNLAGPFFTMQQVGRVMRQQGGGVMVNIILSPEENAFQKGHSAFTAAQSGMIGLTQAAAHELGKFDICVNAVYHGPDETLNHLPAGWDDDLYRRWITEFPAFQQASRRDLVSKVIFMCSKAASSMNGLVIGN